MITTDGLDVSAALAWATAAAGPVTCTGELTGGWTSTLLALSPPAGDDLVLRLMTREPWRAHGPALTTRESQVQQVLAETPVRAPCSVALDADGHACGFPAHLMTRLPGQVDVGRVDESSLGRLADTLAAIHAVAPTAEVRTYESWAWEAKYTVPDWAVDPGVWEDAFALLRTDVPAFDPTFIHRDFHLRNVLWSGDEVSGVVDWVETSIGPAWLDVAHCCSNLAMDHGNDTAEQFAAAYVERTGREPLPYLDVMDVVGFLPPPGREAFAFGDEADRRLEARLGAVLRRLR